MRPRSNSVFIGSLLCSFFLGPIVCNGSFAAEQPFESKKVLILQSYSNAMSWAHSVEDGIKDQFVSSGQVIDVQVEYMDTKRVYDEKYKKYLFDLYEYKYQPNEFDLIISVDNNALGFLVEFRDELFDKTPVVFCGVNNFSDFMLKGAGLFTGTVEDVAIKETIDIALKLHPKVNNIVIYETDTTTYGAMKESVRILEEIYRDKVKFNYIKNSNMEFIEEHAPALNERSLILIVSTMKTADGLSLSYEEYTYRTSMAAKVPIYSFWDFNLGHGVVGGKVISGRSQGETAAKIALDILKGADPRAIKIIKKSPNEYMFDYEQLKKFRIPIFKLPKGSLVVNKKEGFYGKYYEFMFSVLGVFVFLFVLIMLLIIDIQGRKRTENVLRVSERRFREILESSSDWIWETDSDGVYTYVSPKVNNVLGYESNDLLGKTPFDFMSDEEAERVFDIYDSVIKKKGNIEYLDNVYIKKDGQEVVLETNGVPILDHEGHLRGYRGVDRDITARKKAQDELKDSEEKFNKAFYTGSAAMSISELDTGIIIDVNNMFLESTGYERDEVIGKSSKELGLFCDYSDREKIKGLLVEQGCVRSLEVRVRTKGGQERLGLLSSDFIHIPEKEALLTIVTDITELKKSQELMVQSEKMLSVGGLAAGIAHEINNPLAGILQNMQLIRSRFKKDLKKNESIAKECGLDLKALSEYMDRRELSSMMDLIVDSGKRAAKIVNNILSFSRKSDENFGQHNISQLLDEAIELSSSDYDLKKKYDFKNIRITRDYKHENFIVPCEGSQIQQVFFNILRNGAEAIKSSNDPTLTIRMRSDRDMVVIEIEDNGPGFSEEIARRVFEPFFTTKAVGEGTGLGLSVSYFIVVDKHKGKLEVQSSEGWGTKFIVSLPKNHEKIT